MFVDRDEYLRALDSKETNYEIYDQNRLKFLDEIKNLEGAHPGAGWSDSCYFFKIFKDKNCFRIAVPAKQHSVRLSDREYFEDHLLLNTEFTSCSQAAQIVSKFVYQRMGY